MRNVLEIGRAKRREDVRINDKELIAKDEGENNNNNNNNNDTNNCNITTPQQNHHHEVIHKIIMYGDQPDGNVTNQLLKNI